MKTKIIKINENDFEPHSLNEAAEIIKNGGLVVFPTETVYGLGANALDCAAVRKIYAVKGRPPDNPLIVHLAEPREVYEYAQVPAAAEKIMEKFITAKNTSGAPLTIVLKKANGKLDAACANLETAAFRIPKNIIAKKLIELAGVPVAAPSANLSGKPSPTSAAHIIKDLNGRADMIICGGECRIGLESTVISFNSDNSLNILRPGAVTRGDLTGFEVYGTSAADFDKPPSPGMKYTHYAPEAPLYILSGVEADIIAFVKSQHSKKTGFLCYDETLEYFKDCSRIKAVSFGRRDNLNEQARALFGALHSFNEFELDVIYSVEPDKIDMGEALYDRLIKAAGGKIIKL